MRNTFTKVAAAAALVAGMSTSAQAAFVVLTLTDFNTTTNSVEVVKTCSTFDAASVTACLNNGFIAAVGGTSVTFGTTLQGLGGGFATSGQLGVFSIATTSATSNSPGAPNVLDGNMEGLLNRSQTEMTRTQANGLGGATDGHSLFVDFRAFDYQFPSQAEKTLSSSASFSANANAWSASDAVTTFFIVDANNGAATTAQQNCTMTPKDALGNPATGGNPATDQCNLGAIPWTDNGGLYSMRSTQVFAVAKGTTMNSTANSVVRAVPEPMSTALVGIALFGLAVATRRSIKKA